MPAPFAALEARLGSTVLARLANARAAIGGAAAVEAVLSQPLVEARAGQGGAFVRDTQLQVLTAGLAGSVQRGTPVVAYLGDQTVTPHGSFTVDQRFDDAPSGTTTLTLRAA